MPYCCNNALNMLRKCPNFTMHILRVMCVSGHFCNTWLFSNSSFSVLCSKNFEVMKLAATRYDETNVDMHLFLILNMEKPIASFSVIIRIVCTNYSYKLLSP